MTPMLPTAPREGAPESPEARSARAALARTTRELDEAWADVREALSVRVDIRGRVRQDPWLFVGAAFALGFVWGARGGPARGR